MQGRIVRFRRRTGRFKPTADVNLRVRFSAIMPCAPGIRSFWFPFQNRELRVTALNYKPVHRLAAHDAANLALELLKGCHVFVSSASDRSLPSVSCSLQGPASEVGSKFPLTDSSGGATGTTFGSGSTSERRVLNPSTRRVSGGIIPTPRRTLRSDLDATPP
jgi:hypothetical protein